MDKIIITDLLANGIIGVKHPERDQPQDLLINLTLTADLHAAGESDSILDTINYSTVAEVSVCAFHTVETLAAHLARMILESYPVTEVTIRVEKPKLVARTSRVGVEITRSRADFS